MRSFVCGGLVALGAASAMATPNINSAVLHTRIFNDAPTSVLTTTNLYPGTISFTDDMTGIVGGFANRHNFRLSDNGGISDAIFLNGDGFSYSADVTVTGNSAAEAGLNVSPWWSQQVDGNFIVIPANGGEVVVFGGRLPFYSFTGAYGLHYTLGETVRMGINYRPNSLTEADPGTIEYTYTDSSGSYSSGVIPFDQGNPLEDPPYGLWGILNDARVGGYYQPQVAGGTSGTATFENITFIPEPTSLALLGLAGLAALRRRG